MWWDASSASCFDADREISGFAKAKRRSGWKAQGVVIATCDEAESFNHEVVIFPLGQSGDGDAANDAGACNLDGEAASMGSIVFQRKVVSLCEAEAGLLEETADVVRTLVKTRYSVDLARDPALVVGGGAGQRAVEELLVRRSESADVDDDA